MQAKLKEIREELRRRMHWSIPEQGQWLAQVVRGFFAYHAVPTNWAALAAFRHHVIRHWLRFAWERMPKLADAWLPKPKTLVRFAVKHPRQEAYAGNLHVWICAGGTQQ